MAAVTDDEVRSLLRGTRLDEEALFGNSDFGARTLAALEVLPQDLFDANERGRQQVGAGVFWLAFESPDDAADARPVVFPERRPWTEQLSRQAAPGRSSSAARPPLDGAAQPPGRHWTLSRQGWLNPTPGWPPPQPARAPATSRAPPHERPGSRPARRARRLQADRAVALAAMKHAQARYNLADELRVDRAVIREVLLEATQRNMAAWYRPGGRAEG